MRFFWPIFIATLTFLYVSHLLKKQSPQEGMAAVIREIEADIKASRERTERMRESLKKLDKEMEALGLTET